MIPTMLLIPVRDNDNRPFRPSDWLELEERLLTFGGLNWRDDVRGAWEHHGRVYRERNREYRVALASWRQFPAWLEVVLWAQHAFRQVAVYVEVAGLPEVLE